MLEVRRDRRNVIRKLDRQCAFLAGRFSTLLDKLWADRHTVPDPLPPSMLTIHKCVGSVDTFPVTVRRPKNKAWAKAMYNGGKYKRHVVKVQVVAGWNGLPIWISGPHIGVRSDIQLWRMYGPDLPDNERVLGDKAYCSISKPVKVVAPFKGKQIDEEKQDFNVVLRYQHHVDTVSTPSQPCVDTMLTRFSTSWYRAGVEHLFSNFKRFNILGGIYRRQLAVPDGDIRLYNIIRVIGAALALRILLKPLRIHDKLNWVEIERKRVIREAAAHPVVIEDEKESKEEKRERILDRYGHPIEETPEERHAAFMAAPAVAFRHRLIDTLQWGMLSLDSTQRGRSAGGQFVGPGPQPSDVNINTGNSCLSFKASDRIAVWWWDKWWYATVKKVEQARETLTIRWDHDGEVSTGFLPRLCFHKRQLYEYV